MMKTRQKRKAQEGVTQTDGPITISVPDDIDLAMLSNLLPDTSVTSPSPDAIISLYRILLAQQSELEETQHDLESARAEVEKKDVELDQALQDGETGIKEMEAQIETAREELKKVKTERDKLAVSKSKLQNDISELQNSQSQTFSETETLKHRVENVEREKRDLIGVISRLKEEGTQRADEVTTLRANLKEARQEHQKLDAQIRDFRSTETSNKFSIDTLTQQLELTQAEAKRNSDELNAKIDEFTQYRRTKHVQLTELQAAHDSLTQTAESTHVSLKALQSAHSTQSHQLTQALSKVQDLTGQLAEQEIKFANEAGGLKRLVSLMEEREKQVKETVENLENEWASVGQKAEVREAALKDEIEKERRGREQAEKRIKNLETVIEGMGHGELPITGRSSLPATPIRTPGIPGDLFNDGLVGLSPTIAIASRTQKSGKTFTEVYAEFVKLREDYAKKVMECDHMERTLQEVLAQIQERAPILSQQRAEYQRLQTEASELAKQLSQVIAERDAQARLAQESSQKYSKSTAENRLLQQQLYDLGRQVQNLLREIARRDDPTIPADEDFEQIEPVAVDQVITNNLVLFKNINELQAQNQKLLSVVRDLGTKLESEEQEYKAVMEREQVEAVKEAHEAIQELASTLEREKAHHTKVIQAYMKEREALKAMVARSGMVVPPVDVAPQAIENRTSFDSQDGLTKELAEIQCQFEAYKTEMGLDTLKLREDLVQAQREATTATAALAKAEAKSQYMNERSRMHVEQLDLRLHEVENLTKRNNQLQDRWMRLDIECNRLTEDFQVATGRIEQLRNENANLRAEKDIWQNTQSRLLEENRTLLLDRSHLSDLIANVQKMHNDLERSGENDRRRLESQLQILETQTQDLRAQLSHERDIVRNLQLQKELDLKDLQNRLDKVNEEYVRNRENLLAAEMTKKHLEEKVDDMKKRLQGNEEKLAVYERRTGSVVIPQNTDESMSREQQLEAEVAELRSAIKVTEMELANAKEHVQQYQEISKANEEALSDLSSTFDEYRASTEAQVARHETEKRSLEDKLSSLQQELEQIKTKYQELQQVFDRERAAWADDRKLLEGTIVDMSTSEKHSEENKNKWEQDLKAQEQRARTAEDRYSNELVAHAESIQTIETLRKDLSIAQSAARDSSTAAETAQAKLAASESSWKHQKEALDKEITDLNTRYKDLSTQNNVLHQHLESVSMQAARIRQAAGSTSEAQATGGEDSDVKLAELQSVVSWLRREKGIVDLQLQLASDENARFKRQIEHLTKSLQETQATLFEEREKAVEDAASAAQHAELVERITQLNILRESNATLRADCENYTKKSRELETQLRKVTSELEPTQEQMRITQAELDVTKVQLTRLEEESRKWQERSAQLLTKYDRIDPAEVQALKDEIDHLKSSNNDLEAKKVAFEAAEAQHKQAVTDAMTRLDSFKATAQKNNSIFKSRMEASRQENVKIKEEKEKLEARVKELEAEINAQQAVKGDSESIASNNAEATEKAAEQINAIAALTKERDELLAEKEKWTRASGEDVDASAWEKEKMGLAKARDEAAEKLKTSMEDARKAIEDAKNLRFQNEKFQARLHDLLKSKQADAERAAAQQANAVSEAVEKLKGELGSNSSVEEKEALAKKHTEELSALRMKLVEQHEMDLKAAVSTAVEAVKKESLDATTDFEKQPIIDAAIAEYDAKIKAQHEAEIESAVERGRREQMTKGKLKDAQLAKAQKRVKDLEAQILEWKNTGVLPQDATVATAPIAAPPTTPVAATTPAASLQTVPPIQNTQSQPTASTSATPASQPGQPLPRKSSIPAGISHTGVPRGGAPVRGRGGARGAAARIPPVRATPAQVVATTTPTMSSAPGSVAGMSIMGAAAKRPREEGNTPNEDSLAKRLKPAEGTGKGPASIRRPLGGT